MLRNIGGWVPHSSVNGVGFVLCEAVFYNVGISQYPWCFEEKNTTDSKKAHFLTLKNGVRGVSKTPRSQKSVVF